MKISLKKENYGKLLGITQAQQCIIQHGEYRQYFIITVNEKQWVTGIGLEVGEMLKSVYKFKK